MKNMSMTPKERFSALSLASIYAIRMLGLFMILPVFTPFAQNLADATPALIGLALGIYGLSQASLQIPFGMMSDRVGRKPIILAGLLLFVLGSIVAAESSNIYGVIAGRLLQGAGAIGSTTTAFLADLVREEHRSKAMGLIGIVIAFSFFIAMLLGPILNLHVGVSGIFWVTALLGCLAIAIVLFIIPKTKHISFHCDSETIPGKLRAIINHTELFRLDVGIFMTHAILTSCFMALPLILAQHTDFHSEKQWMLYLPVLAISFVLMLPCIIIAEKKRRLKQSLLIAILVVVLSQIALWELHDHLILIAISLVTFFTAFSFLEATLPSLVSKIAPIALKGTAMGVYSSAQFLGIFFGGAVGGWFLKHHDVKSLFLFGALLGVIWLMVAANMKKPRYLNTQVVYIGKKSETELKSLRKQLLDIPGVIEVALMKNDNAAYLRVDKSLFKQETLPDF